MSDIVSRGGFPPLLLAPLSFEQLYMQQQQQQQENAGSAPPGSRIEVAR
jgi:preprotein translocase subunit SecB